MFLRHTRKYVDESGATRVDPSGIISRGCFDDWLATRTRVPNRKFETFRKCLCAHLTCSDGGSMPFPENVETPLLKLLRRSGSVWPAFAGLKDEGNKPVCIGIKGLRCVSYHERVAHEQRRAAVQ